MISSIIDVGRYLPSKILWISVPNFLCSGDSSVGFGGFGGGLSGGGGASRGW